MALSSALRQCHDDQHGSGRKIPAKVAVCALEFASRNRLRATPCPERMGAFPGRKMTSARNASSKSTPMLFPTVEYAVFFLAVLAVAWLLASQLQAHKVFLLAASYVFYGLWSWRYVPLLFAVSAYAWLIAWAMQQADIRFADNRWRKRLLVIGIVGCLVVLVYYKYASFLLLSAMGLWGLVGRTPVWNIPAPFLPLGISFFVFHAISLMGDVYRRKLRGPLPLLDALLYVAFFPQLIAGPILRASKFIPQLRVRRDASKIRVNRAFLLILSGLFKKVIVSNTLATRLVQPVWDAPGSFHAGDVLLAIYGYAAEIYCDFSGYTEIATGCALLLGYQFPRNFNAPYTATDPQDFWQRWHISLSTWLRDYLYIPLGGSRSGRWRTYANLMVTMLLGGLWHGASWTFVAWGGLMGVYLVGHRLWAAWPAVQWLRAQGWWLWVSRVLLFHAVCLGWVFFRSSTFALAGTVLHQLGSRGAVTLASWPVLATLVLGIFGQYAPGVWRRGMEAAMARMPAVVNGAVLAGGVLAIAWLGPTGVAPFIYFQF
jgi:alginate O-acetyltransferase complex protein AlgI